MIYQKKKEKCSKIQKMNEALSKCIVLKQCMLTMEKTSYGSKNSSATKWKQSEVKWPSQTEYIQIAFKFCEQNESVIAIHYLVTKLQYDVKNSMENE